MFLEHLPDFTSVISAIKDKLQFRSYMHLPNVEIKYEIQSFLQLSFK